MPLQIEETSVKKNFSPLSFLPPSTQAAKTADFHLAPGLGSTAHDKRAGLPGWQRGGTGGGVASEKDCCDSRNVHPLAVSLT